MGINDKQVKELLFPAIAMDIITGYNIYPERLPFLDGAFRLSYLHNKLKRTDKHRKELYRAIRNRGLSLLLETENCQRVDRTTAYRLERGWEADWYYDPRGQEINKKDVDQLIAEGIPVIGVSKQFDLRISVDDSKALEKILEVFRKYANAYIINKKTGKPVKYPNAKEPKANRKHRITDAWEVPFISIESDSQLRLPGYQTMKRISLENLGVLVSSLVDRKWDGEITDRETGLRYPTFKEYLEFEEVPFSMSQVLANQILVDWINTTDWSRLEQARNALLRNKV